MAIVLPFGLTPAEIRVLQEYRRLGTETMTAAVIGAIKHPAGGGEAPAKSLVGKGFLTSTADGYALTEKAKALLAIDPKPEFETEGGDEAAEA